MSDKGFVISIEIQHPTDDLVRPLEGANAQLDGSIVAKPPLPRGMLHLENLPDMMSMAHHFADPIIAVAFLKNAKDVIATWIKARSGRKLKLRAGQKTVEVTGPQKIDEVIAFLEKSGEDKPAPAKRRKAAPKQAAVRRRGAPKRSGAKRNVTKKKGASTRKRPRT
jgi:hypothetical protein